MSTNSTSSSSSSSSTAELAQKACDFLTASTDPFHAVSNSIRRLEQVGFQPLDIQKAFSNSLEPGGKYYYTIHGSSLVAFTVGAKAEGTNFGFHIVGGHTDSPNLKIKPRSASKVGASSGTTMLGVECYGGGLWHTWLDRDLSVSGRVLVKTKEDDKFQQRLVNLKSPIARISTLCIHLQSAEERKGLSVNKETHTVPMIATTTNHVAKEALEKQAQDQINAQSSWHGGQEPLLLTTIAKKLGLESTSDIVDWELNLYDTQPAAIGGIQEDFLYSARLDNLATVFCAIESLCDYDGNADSSDINMVVLFDHEEVGSTSSHGAGSPIIQEAVERISAALCSDGTGAAVNPDSYRSIIHRSFCLSIDQAHAIHPNFASKHEPQHAPQINAGLVVKTNSNQRYTTNGITGFLLREIGRRANVPLQEFVVKNDCPCGSTIGPMISAKTGIRTVDAGMPQLSMHSCREVMGVEDLTHGVNLFKTFFKQFREIDSQLDTSIVA